MTYCSLLDFRGPKNTNMFYVQVRENQRNTPKSPNEDSVGTVSYVFLGSTFNIPRTKMATLAMMATTRS